MEEVVDKLQGELNITGATREYFGDVSKREMDFCYCKYLMT